MGILWAHTGTTGCMFNKLTLGALHHIVLAYINNEIEMRRIKLAGQKKDVKQVVQGELSQKLLAELWEGSENHPHKVLETYFFQTGRPH